MGVFSKPMVHDENFQNYLNDNKGGMTFTVTQHEDGWMAMCDQADGFFTGDTGQLPKDDRERNKVINAQLESLIVDIYDLTYEDKAVFSFQFKKDGKNRELCTA